MANIKFNFQGKTAFVTGGSGVLCGAIGKALGFSGANVVILARSNLTQAKEIVKEITDNGGNAIALSCDVLSKESILKATEDTINKFGKIDILINGAGGAHKDATTSEDNLFHDLPEEAIRAVFDLNFLGTFLPSQIVGQIMLKQGYGNILNISSMGAIKPLTRSVAYSAGKAAVTNFTQWLAVHFAQEYKEANIRVNAVVPGFFLTHQNRFLLANEETGELSERGAKIINQTPLARFGTPEDLVAPSLFLLSEESGFIHGETLIVDGGLNAYGGV